MSRDNDAEGQIVAERCQSSWWVSRNCIAAKRPKAPQVHDGGRCRKSTSSRDDVRAITAVAHARHKRTNAERQKLCVPHARFCAGATCVVDPDRSRQKFHF
eukprot:s2274_g6.t1